MSAISSVDLFREQHAQYLELARRQHVRRGRRVGDAAQRQLVIDVGAEGNAPPCSPSKMARSSASGGLPFVT
jgi:hypothetical protein